MKEYIKAIFPAEFKHNRAYWRAFTLGCVMIILAVMQLFRFEVFPGIFTQMQLPGFPFMAWFLAIVIPLLEILSVPYLLSMRVNAVTRSISMWCGFIVCGLWIAVTVWTSATMGMLVDSGLFGGSLTTTSGWWSVVFSGLLLWSYWLTTRELPRRR